ncbi:hydroxyethylthiazole kinase [Planomicrobium sp. YIM 101495]|nr:hydroxyethylthiazole kinase [Planomicrobium sp. YIM 101495]
MLGEVREKGPIIHCITNHVVSNFQANGLLALGASPIMGDAIEETEALTSIAGALSLNIGTLTQRSRDSMLKSGGAANEAGIPVVLDPVGAGATPFRLATVRQLLEEIEIALLRCNAGELAAIAGAEWQAKGVDAGDGAANIEELAIETARRYGLIVAVTGEIDIVTDGETVERIPYGSSAMSAVTGMGCLLSSVAAAFLAVSPKPSVAAVAEASRFYAIAGERAAERSRGPGSLQQHFLDELACLTETDMAERVRMEVAQHD